MTHKHVMICVPTMDYFITAGLGLFMAKASQMSDPKFSICTVQGLFGHAYMRNFFVWKFLNSDADTLWFIDSDMVPPDGAFDLLNTEGDIVGAHYGTVSGNISQVHAMFLSDIDNLDTKVEKEDGEIAEAHGLGMGATWIKRHVLEDKRMMLRPIYDRVDGCRDFLRGFCPPAIFRFNWKPNGEAYLGEDFDFCWRASKLGYKVILDGRPHVRFGHVKPVIC